MSVAAPRQVAPETPELRLAAGAPSRPPYHHGHLRASLIAGTLRLLEAQDADGLSIRELSRRLGVSPSALYHHFSDKADLLKAVAEEGWNWLNRMLAESPTGPTPAENLLEVGLACAKFAMAYPRLYQLMWAVSEACESPTQDGRFGVSLVLRELQRKWGPASDQPEFELRLIAVLCAAHGVANFMSSAQSAPTVAELGGEDVLRRRLLEKLVSCSQVPGAQNCDQGPLAEAPRGDACSAPSALDGSKCN
jgi:AcrR family transcriptional regulator